MTIAKPTITSYGASLRRGHPLARDIFNAWLFIGTASAGAVKGTISNEVDGRYNATPSGSPLYSTGDFGNAISLNGTTQFASTAAEVGPPSQYSLVAIFQTNSATTQVIVARHRSATSGNYCQFFVTNTGVLSASIEMNTTIFLRRSSNASAVALNTWYIGVMTWNGGTTDAAIKTYLNGTRVDTTNAGSGVFTGASTNAIELEIGSQNNGGNLFSGRIAGVMEYSRALTDDEVAWISYDPFVMFRRGPMLKGAPTDGGGARHNQPFINASVGQFMTR